MTEISKRLALNPDKVIEGVPQSNLYNILIQGLQREDEVNELKERYPKKYLIQKGLVTRKEYNTINGHSEEYLRKEQMNTFARLAHQIIGCEIF